MSEIIPATREQIAASYDRHLAMQMANARRLIERGEISPDSQPDWYDVFTYREQQRELVGRRGGCERCSESEIRQVTMHGEPCLVCRRTYRTCPRFELVKIVSLFEEAFR